MSTQSAIRPALAAISVIVSRPTSGRPISAADVPNPVIYTAGNPASSTSRAASGSNAPGATMVCPDSSRALSRAGPPGRRVSLPVTGCPRPAGSSASRASFPGSGQVELAVLDAEGERLPFGRGEDQHRAVGPLAVAHGDHAVGAFL